MQRTMALISDECRENGECDQNEHCSYVAASSRYKCTCQPGYSPAADGQCVPVECSTNPSQCHVNARCNDDGLGGSRCSCIAGFHGDGLRQCVEEHISCNDVNTCAKNAVCGYNQTSTQYACVCLPVRDAAIFLYATIRFYLLLKLIACVFRYPMSRATMAMDITALASRRAGKIRRFAREMLCACRLLLTNSHASATKVS